MPPQESSIPANENLSSNLIDSLNCIDVSSLPAFSCLEVASYAPSNVTCLENNTALHSSFTCLEIAAPPTSFGLDLLDEPTQCLLHEPKIPFPSVETSNDYPQFPQHVSSENMPTPPPYHQEMCNTLPANTIILSFDLCHKLPDVVINSNDIVSESFFNDMESYTDKDDLNNYYSTMQVGKEWESIFSTMNTAFADTFLADTRKLSINKDNHADFDIGNQSNSNEQIGYELVDTTNSNRISSSDLDNLSSSSCHRQIECEFNTKEIMNGNDCGVIDNLDKEFLGSSSCHEQIECEFDTKGERNSVHNSGAVENPISRSCHEQIECEFDKKDICSANDSGAISNLRSISCHEQIQNEIDTKGESNNVYHSCAIENQSNRSCHEQVECEYDMNDSNHGSYGSSTGNYRSSSCLEQTEYECNTEHNNYVDNSADIDNYITNGNIECEFIDTEECDHNELLSVNEDSTILNVDEHHRSIFERFQHYDKKQIQPCEEDAPTASVPVYNHHVENSDIDKGSANEKIEHEFIGTECCNHNEALSVNEDSTILSMDEHDWSIFQRFQQNDKKQQPQHCKEDDNSTCITIPQNISSASKICVPQAQHKAKGFGMSQMLSPTSTFDTAEMTDERASSEGTEIIHNFGQTNIQNGPKIMNHFNHNHQFSCVSDAASTPLASKDKNDAEYYKKDLGRSLEGIEVEFREETKQDDSVKVCDYIESAADEPIHNNVETVLQEEESMRPMSPLSISMQSVLSSNSLISLSHFTVDGDDCDVLSLSYSSVGSPTPSSYSKYFAGNHPLSDIVDDDRPMSPLFGTVLESEDESSSRGGRSAKGRPDKDPSSVFRPITEESNTRSATVSNRLDKMRASPPTVDRTCKPPDSIFPPPSHQSKYSIQSVPNNSTSLFPLPVKPTHARRRTTSISPMRGLLPDNCSNPNSLAQLLPATSTTTCRSRDPLLPSTDVIQKTCQIHNDWYQRGVKRESAGDYSKAVRAYAQALDCFPTKEPMSCLSGGDEVACWSHKIISHTAKTLYRLGTVYWKMGCYPDSIKVLDRSVATYQRLCCTISQNDCPQHETHTNTTFLLEMVETYLSLGRVHQSLGNTTLAYTHYQHAYRLLKKRSSEICWCCQSVARTLYRLGTIHQARSFYSQALLSYHESLRIYTEIENTNIGTKAGQGVDVGNCYHSMGETYEETGRLDLASKAYAQALCCYEAISQNSVEVAVTLGSIGNLSRLNGDYPNALHNLEKAISITIQWLGDHHRNVSALKHGLALVHSEKGNYRSAMKILMEVLDMQTDCLNTSTTVENNESATSTKQTAHPDVAITLWSMGCIYEKKQNLPKGLRLFTKALKLRQAVFGGNHVLVGLTLDQIGVVYAKNGEYTEALNNFTQALTIYHLNGVGDTHARVMELVKNMKKASKKLKRRNQEEAIKGGRICVPRDLNHHLHQGPPLLKTR
eukprot:CAMPEP_0194375396 /NCGR_PEP_ID=MMETSP0174-20130528/23903_1 /TAXON_ID=216777 /ORGANISM="Proboscia alata, Strain PI-D3" /LENGTH=1443 /DNA_ID=CAMNT_0039155561 /DNA_START=23 /DNA_END=4354 /DNA_ORIENTATION=+